MAYRNAGLVGHKNEDFPNVYSRWHVYENTESIKKDYQTLAQSGFNFKASRSQGILLSWVQ